MSDVSWEKVETILDQVLDLPEEKRSTFIEEHCGSDQKLKMEVTQLLNSIFDSEGWLENPQTYKEDFYREFSDEVDFNPGLGDAQSLIGSKIGSYLIMEEIGRGGMGTVYLAERDDQEFDHRVAIKIIRHGKVTDENIQRFRREQQILAELNHPNIARLFDGGVAENGFPFTIMELVDGIPIDEYCRKNECSIPEIVSLLQQVLEAVQHAHENLVIHRDLKPGNILVDTNGHVKILDFGISKLLEEEDDEVLTQTGARLLTPRYAAPEQILQGNITMGTDLYTIGILFYELLSGHPPFKFKGLSPYQIEQEILHMQPSRPSTRTSSKKVQKHLQGDLDAIILKAIRKEPESRYRVANDFLQDLNNYSNGLPVSARDGSLQYRSKKFFQRHKRGTAVAAGILLLVIGFATFYTWRITKEKNIAQREAERAEQVTEFMVSLFQGNFPKHSPGEDVPVSAVINEGLKRLEEEQLNPVNRATILAMIAQIKIDLGEVEEARRLVDKGIVLVSDSISIQNRNTASLPIVQADLYSYEGNFDKAMTSLKMADSLFIHNGLTHTSDYRLMKFQMADIFLELRNSAKALEVINELNLDNFRDNERGIEAKGDYHNYKAIALSGLNKPQEAIEHYHKALEYRKQLFGEGNPELGTIYNNIGNLYYEIEEYDHALEYAHRAYTIRKEALGKDHYLTGSSSWLLASINRNTGDHKKALQYVTESLETHQNSLGPGHIRYILVMRGYGDILVKLGRYDQALEKISSALSLLEKHYPENKNFKSYATSSLAQLYESRDSLDKAAKYYAQTISLMSEALREHHPRIGTILMSYAEMELRRYGCKQALPLIEQTLVNRKQNFEEGEAPLEEAQQLLAKCENSPET